MYRRDPITCWNFKWSSGSTGLVFGLGWYPSGNGVGGAFTFMRLNVTFQLDFTYHTDTSDCSFHFHLFPFIEAHVWYGSNSEALYDTICRLQPCTILSHSHLLYNINLRATITTIPSVRGVMIPINLVSSATDSIRWSIVLFKFVTVPTSDPKSEFLCQSRLIVQNLQTPWTTLYAWDSSHTLITTYHPYAHKPSALTKYLKQKLHLQCAKHLSHSHLAQVEQNVPLERNIKSLQHFL